jgi:hypothetical protein
MKQALLPTALAILLAAMPAAAPPGKPIAAGRGLVPCRPDEVPATIARDQQSTTLNIPPRSHDPERPPEGWCGETAIQEAMLFHGAYYPQKQINAAGHPRHPDLYASDVPVALTNLGMEIHVWRDGDRPPGLDAFLGWLGKQLDAGVPVLCGVKINPTRHPEWGLDHFVLAVGHARDSVTFNTTWGYRVTRTDKQLRSTREKGFAFENRYRAYYGIAIAGPAGRAKGSVPVRLFVRKETAGRLDVVLKCEGLKPGTRYAVYRLSSHDAKVAAPVGVFTAKATSAAFRDVIAKRTPTVYRCRQVGSAK